MNYYERFLSPSERVVATRELAALGEQAIPILESLFDDSAKNAFGVPYRRIGALDCGFVTVGILGPVANALEGYVREGVENDVSYAIEAAGALSEIKQETAFSLARALIRHPASEASASLIRCGYVEDVEVLEIIRSSKAALKNFDKAKHFMSKKQNEHE